MSRARVYNEETLAIMRRFFDAFEVAREHKLIPTVKEFCEQNNIDKAHFYTQRKNLGRGFFEVGWLVPLVDCGVSASWLLTGKGLMFRE